MLNYQTQTSPNSEYLQRDFHGGAIIDSKGREIPLTAEMIDSALEKLSREQERQSKKYTFTPF